MDDSFFLLFDKWKIFESKMIIVTPNFQFFIQKSLKISQIESTKITLSDHTSVTMLAYEKLISLLESAKSALQKWL